MIMAIMMILSIIQVPAWAADGDDPMETADSNELTDIGETDSGEGETEEAAKTLTEIFAEASDGEILTLEQDVTVNGTTDADYKNSGTVTLDLNKHTITGKNNNIALRANAGNGTLKLTNGKIVADQGTYCTVGVSNSTLELSDMELENVTAYGCSIKAFDGGIINLHEVYSKSTTGGGVTAAGGTVNIYDSTFTQGGTYYDHNSVNLSASNGTGTVNVYSGTFTSENYGLYIFSSGGTINVYDGTFDADKAVLKVDLDLVSYPNAEAYVNISGGHFTGKFEIADKEGVHVQITGGTFADTGLTEEQFSAYVPENVLVTEGPDATFTVEKLDETNSVAKVGDDYYSTLSDAFSAAQNGQTVVVLKNVTTEEKLSISDGRSIVMDLNGKSVTSTVDSQFITLNGQGTQLTITDNSVAAGGRIILETAKGGTAAKVGFCVFQGTLNIEKGTIESNGYFQDGDDYWGQMIVYMFGSNEDAANYSQFTLGEDATIVSTRAAEDGKVVNPGYAVSLIQRSSLGTQYGDVAYGANIDIYGETDNAILYVNGTVKATDGNTPSVTVHDGAYIDGGIYAAGYAKYEISGTVVGETGIEIRAGELIVNEGSVITGTATPTEVEPNGNGGTTLGAGVAIAQHTTKLPIKVTINGGTISGFSALYESNPQENTDEDIEKVEIIVSGGTFNATNGGTLAVYSENKTEFISGGTFSSDPSAYVAPGKIALVQNNGMYTIATASATAAEVVAGEPEIKAVDGIDEEVADTLAKTVAAGLTGEANSEANNNTVTAEQGKNALTSAGVTVDTCDTVTIVVQPYLDIEVNAYEADSSDTTTPNTMTLDITPMVRTVATTADVDQGGEIYLETEGDNTQNAAVVETAKELNVRGSITLTIPLPDGFANAGETVYIQHKDIYEYTATVENGGGLHITFVNPHGFSVFTLSTTSAAVAEVDGTSYTSFQAAVDAVENDGTITLMQDNPGTAVVNRAVAFDVETNSHTFNRNSITAASGYTLSGSGNHFVVTRTPVTPDDDDDSSSSSTSSSVRRYDIEADAGRGGDISPDGRVRVRRGENQTFRITADDGYEIYDVEVDGESVGAVSRYTFENVREDHTISATFRQTGAQTEEAQLPFLDVAEGAWYYDAVAYCYENGIMDGTSSVSFAPGMLLNRAMAAQVLYNLADGTASTAAGFPDVAASAWYADAVNWAAANGYVTGYDNGSFGPEDSLTREQLAVILYRYAGSPEPTGSLDGFTDAASASDYAVDALRWAVGEGLLTGKDGGRLDPAGTASRAELAQILARFAQI